MSEDYTRMSIRGLARHLAKDINTVRKYIRSQGAPEPDETGLYDVAAVAAFIEAAQAGRINIASRPKGTPPPLNGELVNYHADLMAYLLEKTPQKAAGKTAEEIEEIFRSAAVRFSDLWHSGHSESWAERYKRLYGTDRAPL